MSRGSERQAALEATAAYHEAQLGELLAHVAGAIDRFRAGELDAFDVDRVVFQYSRAAKELWKFCTLSGGTPIGQDPAKLPAIDWWQTGAFKPR